MSQLELPYEQIKSVLSDKITRVKFQEVKRKIAREIPFHILAEREGFNDRFVFDDIEELADSIFVQGLNEPITVDIVSEELAYIAIGHKRFRAIKHLHDTNRGGDFLFVGCYVNNNAKTELERLVDTATSNQHGTPLTMIEQASNAFKMKAYFGKTHEEIGNLIGRSRQQVDNLITLWELPDSVKKEVIQGLISGTEAIKQHKESIKAQKDADKAEVDANKTATSLPGQKDELATDIKELNELEKDTNSFVEDRIEDAEKYFASQKEISEEVEAHIVCEYIGRKLSLPLYKSAKKDLVDQETGEVTELKGEVVLFKENTLIDEINAEVIASNGENFFVYQQGKEPVAPSIITVEPEIKGKGKYDESREEIKLCQNVIRNADKLESIVSKLNSIPSGTKLDIENLVKWIQNDMEQIRDWVNKNKKQNKIR